MAHDTEAQPLTPAEVADLMATLTAGTAELSPETARTYGAAWKVWQRYAGLASQDVADSTPEALVGFVAWLHRSRYARATVEQRVMSVIGELERRGAQPTQEARRLARAAINAHYPAKGEQG